MKQKILGLDLGTNSIGISVRNTQKTGSVVNQLEYFSSFIFPSGVGTGKTGEFSYAAQRTAHRSTRRLYQARRYRIWSTLSVLIEHGFCPLTKEQLYAWRTYDKSKGLFRQYPINAKEFEQWIRLDFDNDGIPEYTSPYQLRAELMEHPFNFDNRIERYKLGRAIYHIAQRRGFKSSKGETLQEQETIAKGEDYDMSAELQKSEMKKSSELSEYMQSHNCPTVGCAFYHMEQAGIRVRHHEQMQAVRSMYEDEIRQIFTYQKGLQMDGNFYRQLMSHKKGEGCIFYKRPLRSQKGTVGKCTLEKNKSRCPISRPEFEQFRAWTLINNLRYKTKEDSGKAERELPLELRQKLYEEKFIRVSSIKVEDILKWLKREDASICELNYDGKTSVMGSPVCAKLKDLLGEDWMHTELEGYNYEELWHVCYEADEAENVKDFALTHLHADDETVNKLIKLWGAITTDYASLSLKAIRNILRMLQAGYIYSQAVVLAKLPDMFGNQWENVKDTILGEWPLLCANMERNRQVNKITNNLIATYKVLEPEDQFAFRNTAYVLDDTDRKQIKQVIIDTLSYQYWHQLSLNDQSKLMNSVEEAYQSFFHSSSRDYLPILHLDNALLDLIRNNFMDYLLPQYKTKVERDADILYHPSVVSIYAPQRETQIEAEGMMRSVKLLGSPATNIFRNPVVMRVLYQLRDTLNDLIKKGVIDESDTSIVIETARELNDANVRSAIAKIQRDREKENAKYRDELQQYYPSRNISDADIEKIRLWHEQGEICLYTGRTIQISDLLNNDIYEIEHTIPRSISFDDSLANKTICEAHYNRYTKRNLFPSQLPQEDYQAILSRVAPWMKEIERIKASITTCRNKAKGAATKEAKDSAIRDKNVLEERLHYLQNKVSRFQIKRDEWKDAFRSNQLNDTRVITKYAFHFLKSVFGEVSVQRGDMTANFRKALGIQSLEEKKDRSKHSHHAIDATMLTLIPSNTKRDKLLELFYQKEELKRRLETDPNVAEDLSKLEHEYSSLLASCDICGVEQLPDFILHNILIHHRSKDQTLTPSHRRLRVRGKVLTKHGKELWKTGDSLRGSLHMDTWYGAIAPAVRDEEGRMMRDENGNIMVDIDDIKYVVRLPLVYKKGQTDSGFKDWDEIEKVIVDKDLFKILKSQHGDLPFAEACEKGLYMLDSHGNRINRLRHIRCYVPSVKNPIPVKHQTYPSNKDYKQYYWAKVGDLCYLCKYQSEDGKSAFQTFSLYDISKNRECGAGALPPSIPSKTGETMNLIYALRPGMNVLLFNESKDELVGMSNDFLSSRLYVIRGFENPSRINIVHHLSAKADGELGKGESISDMNNLPEKIRCGVSTIRFLVEGIDFELTATGIEFI